MTATAGLHGAEERRGAGAAGSVVGDLQDGGRERRAPAEEIALRARGDVGGEQEGRQPQLDSQGERGIVAARRALGGDERGPPSTATSTPARAAHDTSASIVSGSATRNSRRIAARPAGVIEVGMGGAGGGQRQMAAVPQERRHDPLARVEAVGAARPGVEERRAAVGRLQHDGVALSHVEDGDPEMPVGRPDERPRLDERGGEGQRGCRRRRGCGRVPLPPPRSLHAARPRPSAVA